MKHATTSSNKWSLKWDRSDICPLTWDDQKQQPIILFSWSRQSSLAVLSGSSNACIVMESELIYLVNNNVAAIQVTDTKVKTIQRIASTVDKDSSLVVDT